MLAQKQYITYSASQKVYNSQTTTRNPNEHFQSQQPALSDFYQVFNIQHLASSVSQSAPSIHQTLTFANFFNFITSLHNGHHLSWYESSSNVSLGREQLLLIRPHR